MATATADFDFSASFKTAHELRHYLRSHPDAVLALQTRVVWEDPEERNPLLELSLIDMFTDDFVDTLSEGVDEEKLADMARVLLEEFGVNPHARFGTKAYKARIRTGYKSPEYFQRHSYGDETSTIDLRIRKPTDVKGSIRTCNSALQNVAAHATPEKNKLLRLIIDTAVDSMERVPFFDCDHGDLGEVTAMMVVELLYPEQSVLQLLARKTLQQGIANGKLEDALQAIYTLLRQRKRERAELRRQSVAEEAELNRQIEAQKANRRSYYEAKEKELGVPVLEEIVSKLEAAVNLMAVVAPEEEEEDANGDVLWF